MVQVKESFKFMGWYFMRIRVRIRASLIVRSEVIVRVLLWIQVRLIGIALRLVLC